MDKKLIRSGLLHVKTSYKFRGIHVKAWKKRWVSVYVSTDKTSITVDIFKNEQDAERGTPMSSSKVDKIKSAGDVIAELTSRSRSYAFRIGRIGDGAICLSTDTQQQLRLWMTALTKALLSPAQGEVQVYLDDGATCLLSLHGNQCLLSRLIDGTTVRLIPGALVEKVDRSTADSQLVQLTLNSGTQKECLSVRGPDTSAICALLLRLQGAALISSSDSQSNTWPRNKKNRINSSYENVNNEELSSEDNQLYSQSCGISVPNVLDAGSTNMTGCGALIPENLMKMVNINYSSGVLDTYDGYEYTQSHPSLNIHSTVSPKQNGLTQKLKLSKSFHIQRPVQKLDLKSASNEGKKELCDVMERNDEPNGANLQRDSEVKVVITPCDDYADIDDILMDNNITKDNNLKAKATVTTSIGYKTSKELIELGDIPAATPPTLPRRAKSFSVASKTQPKVEISSGEYAMFRPFSRKKRYKRRKSLDSAIYEDITAEESVNVSNNKLNKFRKSSKPAKIMAIFEKKGRIFRRASLGIVKRNNRNNNNEILCHSENDLIGTNGLSKYNSVSKSIPFINYKTDMNEFSSQPEVRTVLPSGNISENCLFMMPKNAPFHPAPSYSFDNILNETKSDDEEDNIGSIVNTGNTGMYYDHLLEYLGEVVEELDETESEEINSVSKEIKCNLNLYSKSGSQRKVKRTPSQLAAHESIYMAMDSSVRRKAKTSPKRKLSDTTYMDMTQVTR